MSQAPNRFSNQPENPYAPPQTTTTPPPVIPAGASQYAACPKCRGTYAKPVGFTWWGGILGPKMFTHVKCVNCNTAYNGKTGNSNATAITIYVIVSFIIALGVFGLLALGGIK